MSVDPVAENNVPASKIWTRLHQLLVLREEDAALLRSKRGFSDETISRLGFRSSVASNKPILESLAQEFPAGQLHSLGIYYRARDGNFYPNPQFCGYGMTGEKNEKGEPVWRDNVNPVLIPYLDESGQATTIRPHKGNVKRPEGVDPLLDEDYTGLHPYCPSLLRTVTTLPRYIGPDTEEGAAVSLPLCVITEGEFKAAALWQCGIPAIAFPGIQSLANAPFCKQVVQLLNRFLVEKVVIVFDNEVKDDPALPNYKADPWKRYDSVVYARYTAKKIYLETSISTQIGMLPDAWRVRGKADWDGALSRFVSEEKSADKGTTRAQKEFLKVLHGASFDKGVLDLFPSEAQRVVEAKLSRLYHRPECPFGDDKFRELAQRFREVDPPLSKAFGSCVGRYYTRTPMSNDRKLQALLTEKEGAERAGDKLRARALQERLNGIPKDISNFVLSCEYKLVSASHDTEYLVRLRNIHNEKTPTHVRFSSATLAKLTEFRTRCLQLFCSWKGGEKDLQALTVDMQAASAFREIYEIDTYGWSEECRLWKFGDRAFTSEGKLLLPDKNNVFWHEGVGYQTDFNSQHIGDGFLMGAPVLGDLNLTHAAESFTLLTRQLRDAVGNYDGWLALGLILSYAAHPELFKAHRGAPGLWMTGKRGSGKSTVCRWLVRVWGFPGQGISLIKTTTDNGVSRELAKYGSIPAWLDEFDHLNTSDRVQDMLKSAFDRLVSSKATFDQTKRTRGVQPITTPMVSGETGTRVAATRSRYLQILVLKERSLGSASERLKIMNAAEDRFRNLGHFLMANRPAFVRRFTELMDEWMASNQTAEFIAEPRARLVTGTPYAAWRACAELLERNETLQKESPEVHNDLFELLQESENLRKFALTYGSEEESDNAETTYIHTFWQDIYNMLQTGSMKPSFFKLSHAKIENRSATESYDRKFAGSKPVMYMAAEPAYLLYEQEIRKAGRNAKMSYKDIQREVRSDPSWLLPPRGQTSHRIRSEGRRYTGWAFDLEEHCLGPEFLQWLEDETERSKDRDDDGRQRSF